MYIVQKKYQCIVCGPNYFIFFEECGPNYLESYV